MIKGPESSGFSESPSEDPIFMFDLTTGQLLVGEDAVATHFESGGNPMDVIPLDQLLLDQQNTVRSDSFEHLDVDDWTIDDYLSYGAWLDNVLKKEGQTKSALSERLLTRSYYYGLGPGVQRFKADIRFGSLGEYYKELGTVPKYERGIYDSWTRADFADYVEGIYLELTAASDQEGGYAVSIAEELRRREKLGEGPSVWVIYNRAGRIMHLLDLKGYADIVHWDDQDYVDWGVKFMFANEGKLPNTPSVNELAKTRRAPTARSIFNNFGSMVDFQERVMLQYEDEVVRRESARKNRFDEITRELSYGELPASLIEEAAMDAMFAAAGKYRVVHQLLPDLDEQRKISLARAKIPDDFVKRIRAIDPLITAGAIEESALVSGVFDDIWPMDEYMNYLRVS
jgi:hypothetical protein